MCKQCGDIFKSHPAPGARVMDLTQAGFTVAFRVLDRRDSLRGLTSREQRHVMAGYTREHKRVVLEMCILLAVPK